MYLLLSFLAFAQVGPFTRPGPQPVSPLPPEIVERKRQEAQKPRTAPLPPTPPTATRSELDSCLGMVDGDAQAAVDHAQAWLQRTKGVPASHAGHCLGVALSRLERWDEAESAFLGARDLAADKLSQARLGAMAGNAALAGRRAEAALAALDPAQADAKAAGSKQLGGAIAIDRARALVALKRDSDAAAALAEAREAVPGDAQVWLLSATLSRRMGKLAEAQAQIEKAAALLPADPDVGLEAGVIAVLAGRDDAARKSWQSVIAAAPKSDAAATAKGYLAQLGAPTAARP